MASPILITASYKYRKCLRNHATSVGDYVVDGCGEFMQGGNEGNQQALICVACGCHRNFHQRELIYTDALHNRFSLTPIFLYGVQPTMRVRGRDFVLLPEASFVDPPPHPASPPNPPNPSVSPPPPSPSSSPDAADVNQQSL
ncbi:zinc-finger homeodomain protein 2-like [Cornus florida]|uniref:zinc-finger homeodomain protein 2-like n=1 Tax=Cornus florida TaxID=4283 RepID=UPI0028A03CD0|nr:zinc-finger homeodomain protein 2-like [Cornus florida]